MRIVFGLYQTCGNRGSVGCVSVFVWCRWRVGRELRPGSGRWGGVSSDYLCRWQV